VGMASSQRRRHDSTVAVGALVDLGDDGQRLLTGYRRSVRQEAESTTSNHIYGSKEDTRDGDKRRHPEVATATGLPSQRDSVS
jgi:hypothetical protein